MPIVLEMKPLHDESKIFHLQEEDWLTQCSGVGTVAAVAALAATLFRPKSIFITCYNK